MATPDPTAAKPYDFFAMVEGMRFPLKVEKPCDSDAEAGLIAISLSTRILGIEVCRGGAVVFAAPPRALLKPHRPTSRVPLGFAGTGSSQP